jgi:hypothetical protein
MSSEREGLRLPDRQGRALRAKTRAGFFDRRAPRSIFIRSAGKGFNKSRGSGSLPSHAARAGQILVVVHSMHMLSSFEPKIIVPGLAKS